MHGLLDDALLDQINKSVWHHVDACLKKAKLKNEELRQFHEHDSARTSVDINELQAVQY
jgi:hypothetical protein